MNLKEVKEFTEGLLKDYFKPKVLKKFDEDANGNLVYDKSPISAKVSGKNGNAIEVLSDATTPANSGLYVEDLKETAIKQINIAQKTVNTLGYDDLMSTQPTFEVPYNNQSYKVDKTFELDKPITDYEFIDIYMSAVNVNSMRAAQVTRLKVSDIVYNPTKVELQDLSIFSICHQLNGSQASGGDNTFVAKGWFLDPTHLYIAYGCNPQNGSWKTYRFDHILGISKEVITIDPMNYVDTKQGVQDVPVGTLIETEGKIDPDHYLLCDGRELNILDYRDLAEAIKKAYGSYNQFGGDGETTFALPLYTNYNDWFSPKQTSNTSPYNVSASSTYSNWQVWWAFNNNCTTSLNNCWHSAVGSKAGHWIQIDFKTPMALNGLSMTPRNEAKYNLVRMPINFKIIGSNDGTNWTTIDTYTNIQDYQMCVYREFIFPHTAKYRYYRIADIEITESCVNISDIHFLKAPEKYVYIKYEPTYFVGSINGQEVVDDLITSSINYAQNVTPTDSHKLLHEITDYDYIEVHACQTYSTNSTFGHQIMRIPVKDIVIQPDKHEWQNTWQMTMMDASRKFNIWFGFNAVDSFYIGRVQAENTAAAYTGPLVISIRGIKVVNTISNSTIGGNGGNSCNCEQPTDADITSAINNSITELNK